jgi:hypothetical protein
VAADSQRYEILGLAHLPIQGGRVLSFICSHYYLKPYREDMFTIQDKYKFGYADYLKGNKIFERALAVNRLEELLEKRDQFDWSEVPEMPLGK